MKKLLVLLALLGLILNNGILVIAGAPNTTVQNFINNSDIIEDFTKIPNIERCSGGPYDELKSLLVLKGLSNKVETGNYSCINNSALGFAESILNILPKYPDNFFNQNNNFKYYKIVLSAQEFYDICGNAQACAGGSYKIDNPIEPVSVFSVASSPIAYYGYNEYVFHHEVAHDMHLTFNGYSDFIQQWNS